MRVAIKTESSLIESSVPSGMRVERPYLVGASAQASEAFDRAFDAKLNAAIANLGNMVGDGTPADGQEDCTQEFEGKQVAGILDARTLVTGVARDMAGATTSFSYQVGCPRPMSWAESVAVGLRTGQVLKLTDIADPSSPAYQSEAVRLVRAECPGGTGQGGILGEDQGASLGGDDTAFTPTAGGLTLTWDERVLVRGCSPTTVTMPWASAGVGTSSAGAGGSAFGQPGEGGYGSGQSAVSGGKGSGACPAGAKLPEGIDARVCGPIPVDAGVPVTIDDEGFGSQQMVASPTGNILCAISDGFVECSPHSYTFSNPDPGDGPPDGPEWFPNVVNLSTESSSGGYLGDAHPATAGITDKKQLAKIALPYGRSVFSGDVVCLSQEIGMSCWNASTRHGFFVSKSQLTTW